MTFVILNMRKRIQRPVTKKRTTVSIAPELLRKGEERAREARRNFSNYIEILIERDLALAGNGDTAGEIPV